jgi:hypothetical protein
MKAGGIAPLLLLLTLSLPVVSATNSTDCSWDFPTQMGSGGGILMFFLGFMTGALVLGMIWLLVDQRWRSWHLWGRDSSATAPQYQPMPPQAYLQPDQPQPGYAPTGYAPQPGLVWPNAVSFGNYQTTYDLITPYR